MFTKFSVTTHSRCELVDITAIVQEIVSKSGAESAVCFIYTPHTTSGIAINENADPDVAADIAKATGEDEKAIPRARFCP